MGKASLKEELPDLDDEFRAVLKKSVKEDREYGFNICQVSDDLISENHVEGGLGEIEFEGCDVGQKVGTFHTHPPLSDIFEKGPTTIPSREDFDIAFEQGLAFICVGAGEKENGGIGGKIECSEVPNDLESYNPRGIMNGETKKEEELDIIHEYSL